MTTVKMPRQHNRKKFLINYGEIVRWVVLHVAYGFFWVLVIWGIYVFYVWTDNLILENHTLKMELHEEKTAFKTMFVEQQLDEKQKEKERQEYVKKMAGVVSEVSKDF